MPRKRGVEYVQNAEPAFIRKFKERAGIPEADVISTKHTTIPTDDNECGDRVDELPQIVLESDSGVSESDARAFLTENAIKDNNQPDAPNSSNSTADTDNGKIVFRSAAERRNNRPNTEHNQPDKSRNRGRVPDRDRSPVPKPMRSKSPPKKGGLLSFNADEEDD